MQLLSKETAQTPPGSSQEQLAIYTMGFSCNCGVSYQIFITAYSVYPMHTCQELNAINKNNMLHVTGLEGIPLSSFKVMFSNNEHSGSRNAPGAISKLKPKCRNAGKVSCAYTGTGSKA